MSQVDAYIFSMCERLEDVVASVRRLVETLDASEMQAHLAMRTVELLATIERLAAGGRTLAAGRVQQTRAWRATGAASAAAWMAQRTGATLSGAAMTLNNAQRLKQLPAVKEAFLEGRLSELQVAEVSAAAVVDRTAERQLVEIAQRETVARLREHCRDVRAAALGDEDVCERIRRGRFLRHWNERDGAVRMDARLAPDDAAPLIAVVRERAERLRLEALRSGQREPGEAYAADALVSLVDGAPSPRAVVHVHVSGSALERGRTVAGETCRIDGVGPIPVAAARRFAAEGVVKILEARGVDVRRVAHAGRVIPAHLRTALETRDPSCVVPGCDRRERLEIDHIVPLSSGGATSLDNLARLCRWHHAQKTHHGWELSGRPGDWRWTRGRRVRAGGVPAPP